MGNKWAAQTVCDECWKRRYGDRTAYRVREPDLEKCAFCGLFTESGIYERLKLSEVPFPTYREDV